MSEENSEEIEVQGRKVVELFTACAAAPDDLAAAEAADAALAELEVLLRDAEEEELAG
ncbi:hypothetical protein I2W78_07795 [Streptomyces spinoverrucosus]|uniref:hypothetical protein n=1 Tax=Streptomyces spinoverrucosus TaxID=284043 RepID=UPI0018C36677|nr:hypothetical protein [Streptomyces spinoverrucosus]MBG0851748.1 hypothetical protein [Streptomyces spinoverrucosus]